MEFNVSNKRGELLPEPVAPEHPKEKDGGKQTITVKVGDKELEMRVHKPMDRPGLGTRVLASLSTLPLGIGEFLWQRHGEVRQSRHSVAKYKIEKQLFLRALQRNLNAERGEGLTPIDIRKAAIDGQGHVPLSVRKAARVFNASESEITLFLQGYPRRGVPSGFFETVIRAHCREMREYTSGRLGMEHMEQAAGRASNLYGELCKSCGSPQVTYLREQVLNDILITAYDAARAGMEDEGGVETLVESMLKEHLESESMIDQRKRLNEAQCAQLSNIAKGQRIDSVQVEQYENIAVAMQYAMVALQTEVDESFGGFGPEWNPDEVRVAFRTGVGAMLIHGDQHWPVTGLGREDKQRKVLDQCADLAAKAFSAEEARRLIGALAKEVTSARKLFQSGPDGFDFTRRWVSGVIMALSKRCDPPLPQELVATLCAALFADEAEIKA